MRDTQGLESLQLKTPLGEVLIIISSGKLLGSALVGPDAENLICKLSRQWGGLPKLSIHTTSFKGLEDRMLSVRQGGIDQFLDLELDFSSCTLFQAKVYALTRKIVPGDTWTYGQLASALGQPKAARAVGGALRRNPFVFFVPCHRVVQTCGKVGGFLGVKNCQKKQSVLRFEEDGLNLG